MRALVITGSICFLAGLGLGVVLTYDELDRSMPTGWRAVAGEDFNLMTFMDPTTMHELRPLMRGGFRSGGPGGGRDAPPPQ